MAVDAEVRSHHMPYPDVCPWWNCQVLCECQSFIPCVEPIRSASPPGPIYEEGHFHAPCSDCLLLLPIKAHRDILHHVCDQRDVRHFKFLAHPSVVACPTDSAHRDLRV